MPQIEYQALSLLHERGVQFCISVPNEAGQQTYVATPADVLTFMEDKDAIYAKALGVTKSEYRDWMEEGCMAYCAATTRGGRPCRGVVPGGHQVNAARWVALKGEYCTAHAEGSGATMRAVTAHS